MAEQITTYMNYNNPVTAIFTFLFRGNIYTLKWHQEYYAGGWIWHEGNFACDCNRSLFMNEQSPDFPILDCGNEIILLKIDELIVTE